MAAAAGDNDDADASTRPGEELPSDHEMESLRATLAPMVQRYGLELLLQSLHAADASHGASSPPPPPPPPPSGPSTHPPPSPTLPVTQDVAIQTKSFSSSPCLSSSPSEQLWPPHCSIFPSLSSQASPTAAMLDVDDTPEWLKAAEDSFQLPAACRGAVLRLAVACRDRTQGEASSSLVEASSSLVEASSSLVEASSSLVEASSFLVEASSASMARRPATTSIRTHHAAVLRAARRRAASALDWLLEFALLDEMIANSMCTSTIYLY
ncbi:hypothetical protein AB1Y20_011455 [Prymnesium parvum]|uniref:Nuclear pore complex protein n=1 Tax=Prymnesium parvum TaxID=97485 RepID=A0AB34INY6_PRYPA